MFNIHIAQDYVQFQYFFFQLLFLVVIIDPGINNADNYKPYQDGVTQDIFIKVRKMSTEYHIRVLKINGNVLFIGF